jgi:hypothetical protein
MTSEWLGEMFKGDSADTGACKFPLVSMGGRANGQTFADGERGRANGQTFADGERGPPSAREEIFFTNFEAMGILTIFSFTTEPCLVKFTHFNTRDQHS